MILDLGQTEHFFRVTTEFSNAVLVALMPHVSDVAQKLDLPVPQPISQQQVVGCGILPYVTHDGQWGGCGILIKGGWQFGFGWGYLNRFESPHAYYGLQDPDEIPKFYGVVRMTQDEAIQKARDTLKKLNIPLEAVFAEQPPRVTLPPKIHQTNTVPHYRIEWINPRANSASVDIEINADARRVERIYISSNPSLRRPWPDFGVSPALQPSKHPANPEYAWKLIPIVLHAIDEYGQKLSLPLPGPLTTNHIARFELSDNGGWPHCEVELTNGWQFVFRNSMVNGYYAPDNFFNSDYRPILIKEFKGKWKLSQNDAFELVKKTLLKLKYPTNLVHIDFAPEVRKPVMVGEEIIPRYRIEWNYVVNDELQSKVEAEVDADSGKLKSLYYDDASYWNHPPPIDVPITLPPEADTPPAQLPSKSRLEPKSPQRPMKAMPPNSPK